MMKDYFAKKLFAIKIFFTNLINSFKNSNCSIHHKLNYISNLQVAQFNEIVDRMNAIHWSSESSREYIVELMKNNALDWKNNISYMDYVSRIEEIDLQFHAESQLAEDSNDCIYPQSTTDGFLRKPRLSKKILQMYGDSASFLDIGCGCGGLVYDATRHGILSYGLDGSTYNLKMQNGYWAVLDKTLATCDASKPFHFRQKHKTNSNPFVKETFRFKIISSWECLEHIPEDSLRGFFLNIYNNLDDDGYFIGSISRMPYEDDGIVYHVTLKDENWWKNKFLEVGLDYLQIEETPFDVTDFSRGIGYDYQDMHTNYLKNKDDGFIFVAKKQ